MKVLMLLLGFLFVCSYAKRKFFFAPISASNPGRSYEVKNGDFLISIALKECGNANRYLEILQLNPELQGHPDLISPGMTLILPQNC